MSRSPRGDAGGSSGPAGLQAGHGTPAPLHPTWPTGWPGCSSHTQRSPQHSLHIAPGLGVASKRPACGAECRRAAGLQITARGPPKEKGGPRASYKRDGSPDGSGDAGATDTDPDLDHVRAPKAVKPAEGPGPTTRRRPTASKRWQKLRRRSARTKDRAHLVEAEGASADNSNSSMKS
jgi:hypothetical protein